MLQNVHHGKTDMFNECVCTRQARVEWILTGGGRDGWIFEFKDLILLFYLDFYLNFE